MGYIYFALAFAAALIFTEIELKREKKKANIGKFYRGGIVSNTKTRKIGVITNVDYHNRVLHTSIGGFHFSNAEAVEVGCFVYIIKTKKSVEIKKIEGKRLITTGGEFNISDVTR